MSQSWDAYLAFLLPSLLAAVPGSIAIWQWWVRRHDGREDVGDAREAARIKRLDMQQQTLDTQQIAWFGALRAENAELRVEIASTRRDRDRGWDLARWWHGAALGVLSQFHDLRHNALNMQQWIASARSLHSDLGVLRAIEPVPGRINLPMGLETPQNGKH